MCNREGQAIKATIEKITLQDTKQCWVCTCTNNLENHHVFGASNRKKSEKYGLKAWLCKDHHTGRNGIHFDYNLMLKLKKYAQAEFEKVYSREMFTAEFGRNYL